MRRCLWIAILSLAIGCSNKADVIEAPDAGADLAATDQVADVSIVPPEDAAPDQRFPDTGVETVSDDTADEETASPCGGESGCFLDSCMENGECLSGWCVEHMGEGVCSQNCDEECPPGWSCRQVGTGPDIAYICVSSVANLCRPCTTGADCKSPGGSEDVCVDYGEEGSFCGGACLSNEECPWGFSCAEAVSVDGVTSKQCLADTGTCPCTAKSVALSLSTPCEVTNEFGTCKGKRVCTADGLTDCGAAEPSIEACNGVDDDCDGEADEPTLVNGVYVGLCDDGNECTKDLCTGEAGCEHEALDAGECKDGDACTVGDHCEEGVCVGTPVECDDDNPCTDDSCDGTGGCHFVDNDVACDDGNACTVADRCDGGTCTGVSVDCQCQADADCAALEDGDLCNGTLMCDLEGFPHLCVVDPATVVSCPAPPAGPDAPCLAAACDGETGGCALVPANEGWACDDGDPCTVGEKCVGGACAGGLAANCQDGNVCTDDSCMPGEGCVHAPNTKGCTDDNVCTLKDQCVDGECLPGTQLLACDDGNPCTTDSCNPAEGCVHGSSDGECSDGNACTTGDACVNGLCVAGQPVACNDDNPCTNDSCNPASGCVFSLNSAPCDDGDLCTTGDHCQLGECIGGGQLPCNDNNPCTDDSCNSKSGCSFVPNDAVCDDGNDCTEEDHCAGGWCVGGPAADCDDGDPCTDDACDPESGCVHALNTAPCSDGNACTVGDACSEGASKPRVGILVSDDGLFCNGVESCNPQSGCVAGTPPVLTDDVPCTSDLCDEELNVVVHIPVDALCDDGEFCNGVESCHAASGCQPGTPVAVDDAIDCTLDSCDEEADEVVHVADDGLCDDGTDCTADSCDPELGCVFVEVGECWGPHYVLTGNPDPSTVFNVIAETHFYPNNLVNSVWHGPSNKMIVGHGYDNGYWSYDATNGSYTTTPNMGGGDYDRMVFIPKTRVVVHTDNQYKAAPASGIWVGTIDDEGNVSAFQKASFGDGFNGTCNLMSASADQFMCFTGADIRFYDTVEGSNVFTYDKTLSLTPAPQDPCTGGCYQGTFAWDGKYYYFALQGSQPSNLQYQVYTAAGAHHATYSAPGIGAINGAYFDWSSGRYSTHDGWGNRKGGNYHWPTNGSQGDDSQVFGPQSPYHTLQK